MQIAESLESAHEEGIVHRDLKPANVMITDDGRVKVLDFGLAKALEGPAVPASQDQTVLLGSDFAGVTAEGRVLGTPAYMSTEQIESRPVDARSDVFAFGCLLYEMLTGVPPFHNALSTLLTNGSVPKQPFSNAL